MTISELIAQLEETKEKYGDIEVRVQYRDEGGDYGGEDEYLYCKTVEDDGKNIFIL